MADALSEHISKSHSFNLLFKSQLDTYREKGYWISCTSGENCRSACGEDL